MTLKDQILSQVERIPPIPGAVAHLSTLIHSKNAGAGDFEKVIKLDPAMTANILHIANSSYFGCPKEVTSVRQAVVVIGARRVFEAALATSMLGVLPDKIAGYDISSDSFWVHSIAVAMVSERLAKELKLNVSDLVFTGGLLHDIGKLAIGTFLSKQQQAVKDNLDKGDEAFVSLERKLLGIDHSEIGIDIAKQWNFPDPIVWAVGWHHRPNETPEGADQNLIDLVHIADSLAHSLGFGADVGELSRKVEPETISRLGLKVGRLEYVASEILDQINEIGHIFRKATGGE